MKSLVLSVVFSLFTFSIFSQSKEYKVIGSVVDSLNQPLPYTTVVLLSSKDSSLQNYAVSNGEGKFEMNKVKESGYIFQLSFMGYRTFSKSVLITGTNPVVDLGVNKLVSNSQLLSEVSIEGNYIPIVFRNDTVEYNASSFKTQKGANAEKLLSKMPGIEVDSDGEVTAHGEKVEKIYVDGKEFFGDDPKIATKNIPADAIDKVQVFDKKSELSEYTGVDDGVRKRTINITLKEDRKKGIFGEASIGGGHESRYKGKLNLNRFSKKAQFTSLLMANNVNEQGFSYQDYFNFMGGIANVIKTGKMSFDPTETGIPINIPGTNNGIASTLAGGINYNQDIGKSTHLISSFFINNSNSDIDRTSNTENILPQSSFISNTTDNQDQLLQNYRLNAKIQHEFNLKNRLDISTVGILTKTNIDGLNTENQLFSDNSLNLTNGTSLNKGNGINSTISLDYKRRFEKKGRSINVLADFYYLNNENTADIENIRQVRLKDGTIFSNALDQTQFQLIKKNEYFAKIAFTEQLTPKTFIIADYSYYDKFQENNKDFFENSGGARTFLQALSNFFTSKYHYNQLGVKYNYKLDKNMFVIGLDAQQSRLIGTRDENTSQIDQKFQVLLPNFSWRKIDGMSSRINLNYSTSFNEPSITQLQPVIDNSNPLNVYIGNPELKPEYTHNLSFNWFTYDAFSFRQAGVYVNAYFVNNDINNARYFDSVSKLQITTPQNIQDNLGLNSGLRYGFRIPKFKTQIKTAVNFSVNQGYNLVDNQENKSLTYNYGGSLTFSNTNNKTVDARLELSSNANLNQIGIGEQESSSYVNSKILGEVNIELKKDWEIGISGTQNFFQGRSLSTQQQFFILDAFVAKTIFKNRRGNLKLAIYDALNQRTGISNYGQANYLVESNVNVLKRYSMLTFTYKIIKI